MSAYPEYVWLHRLDCTHAQIHSASDRDGNSYLVHWESMSKQQKAEWLAKESKQ